MDVDRFRIEPGRKIALADHDPGDTGRIKDKKQAKRLLQESRDELAEMQARLWAQDTYSLLIILQAMDAAGKDSTIKHVMRGVNPQGCQVYSFRAPSHEERDHDYLWRHLKALPERGRIGIHNRSWYEEVLIARVMPEVLRAQQLPEPTRRLGKELWPQRFRQINDVERHLVENGTVVLKFFLNVSKAEQKKRFLDRIDRPEKNWKFEMGDLQTRERWDDYMAAYEDVFRHTSTAWAPWWIVPADHKWFTRVAVATVINQTLKGLKLKFPTVTAAHRAALAEARKRLEAE